MHVAISNIGGGGGGGGGVGLGLSRLPRWDRDCNNDAEPASPSQASRASLAPMASDLRSRRPSVVGHNSEFISRNHSGNNVGRSRNSSETSGGDVLGSYKVQDDGDDDDGFSGPVQMPPLPTMESMTKEIERLRQDKLAYIYEIEHHKRRLTYAIVFGIISFALALSMIIWRLNSPLGAQKASYEEQRRKIVNPDEDLRPCTSTFPADALFRQFDEAEVGQPLVLTDYIEQGRLQEGVEMARVDNILQTEVSYSGFLNVNRTHNSSLFFWFFPAKKNAKDSPLLLWLEGGPGWPTTYALFKENGPFLVGWDPNVPSSYLLPNKYTWTEDHNILYIDNPVGTGFSYTETEEGYPVTDQETGASLLEAMRQFMKLYPFMVRGAEPSATPFYAFGQSYGGAYVLALAHEYLSYRENNPDHIKDVWLKGVGIGNGFISPTDQSVYSGLVQNLGYVSEEQVEKMAKFDQTLLDALEAGNYSAALDASQSTLRYIVYDLLNLTNIYEFTNNHNYLTNHEYVCFLQQKFVRYNIHVGSRPFNQGLESYNHLNNTIMASKKAWLQEILQRGGIEVLVYNGNLDIIVHVAGMNRVINSLEWSSRGEFLKSPQRIFWVWNEDTSRPELAGYVNQGGGLTYAVVRNAGHMVPISQPRWAKELVRQFTHLSKQESRYRPPLEVVKSYNPPESFEDCR